MTTARFYEVRCNTYAPFWSAVVAFYKDKAPGKFPAGMTDRYIISPDLRTHLCSLTPSVPAEQMDCAVYWDPEYEPTEEEREFWNNEEHELSRDDNFCYFDWHSVVKGFPEVQGFKYDLTSKWLAVHDMGDFIAETENELWEAAREAAQANHHV